MNTVIRWKGGAAIINEQGSIVEEFDLFESAADRCYELNNEKNKTGNDEHVD